MSVLQPILVYLTLAIAIFYLAKKYLLPKRLFASKKGTKSGCEEGNCGCH
ncbi:hypothetical protein [uncultured Eudoraea sp.]|nr:hypothetical protein [uncultured Eudoraea sp.]MBT8292630.1 hypothetical protein [Eudoraea sp.]